MKSKLGLFFAAFSGTIVFIFLGCATYEPNQNKSIHYFKYYLTSTPSGADIYMGSSPYNMSYCYSTPYHDYTTVSKKWSGKYFQAKKSGYKDSGIHLQPAFKSLARIHFDLIPLESNSANANYGNTVTNTGPNTATLPTNRRVRNPEYGRIIEQIKAVEQQLSEVEDQKDRLLVKHGVNNYNAYKNKNVGGFLKSFVRSTMPQADEIGEKRSGLMLKKRQLENMLEITPMYIYQ